MGFLARVGRRQLRRGSALCSYRTNVRLGVCRARKHQGRLFSTARSKDISDHLRRAWLDTSSYIFYRFNQKISLGIKEIKFHGLRSVSLSCGITLHGGIKLRLMMPARIRSFIILEQTAVAFFRCCKQSKISKVMMGHTAMCDGEYLHRAQFTCLECRNNR